jgi:hypothetical protein
VRLGASQPTSWTRLPAAVVAAVVLTVVGCGANDDSASDRSTAVPAPETMVDSTQPESRRAAELAAIRTARRFLDARNAWDGPAMRALVADDADVADFAVEAPDDYLAMAVLERTLQWQYLDPECTATLVGAVAHVRCTYVMQNRLSQATETGPYSGSRIDFENSDGFMQMVANTFDHTRYGDEVLVPFTEWLNANHPGDADVMFFTNELGDVNRSLSPESLALWAERLPEYVATKSAG